MLRLLQEVNMKVDDQNPQLLILVKHICSNTPQLLSVPRPGSYMAGDCLSTSSPLGCFHLLSSTGQIHTCTPIRVYTVAMEIQSYMWLQGAEQDITNTFKDQLLSLKVQLPASNPHTWGPESLSSF